MLAKVRGFKRFNKMFVRLAKVRGFKRFYKMFVRLAKVKTLSGQGLLNPMAPREDEALFSQRNNIQYWLHSE